MKINIKKHKKLKFLNIKFVLLFFLCILAILLILILLNTYKNISKNLPTLNSNNVTSTNTPTQDINKNNVLVKGSLLGTRPVITGGLGWTLGGVKDHLIFFQKAKDLGIDNVRIFSVIDGYKNNQDNSTNLNNAINAIHNIGQNIMLCLGDPSSPPISKLDIDNNAKALKLMLNDLVSTYSVNDVNNLPIELDNEYGGDNLTYLINSYYKVIQDKEKQTPGLNIKIILPASQRQDFVNFENALKYSRDNNLNIYGISIHYYLKGKIKVSDPSFATWSKTTNAILTKYHYDNLPLYIDEYGLSGNSKDTDLKTSFNAAWLASRLNDKTYYDNKNYNFYISGIYGQPYSYKDGGWLGLFDGFSGSEAAYPIEREFELENKFGNSTLYNVSNMPTNMGGITDGNNKWLLWNLTDKSTTINLAQNTPIKVGLIDNTNGNSNTIENQVKVNAHWTNDSIESLNIKSNPFNDPQTGKERNEIVPVNGIASVNISSYGVVYIENK